MATSPTTASSFSPYCDSDASSVWASTQVKMLTSRPSAAPTSTGRRSRRRMPTNEAVMAASRKIERRTLAAQCMRGAIGVAAVRGSP